VLLKNVGRKGQYNLKNKSKDFSKSRSDSMMETYNWRRKNNKTKSIKKYCDFSFFCIMKIS